MQTKVANVGQIDCPPIQTACIISDLHWSGPPLVEPDMSQLSTTDLAANKKKGVPAVEQSQPELLKS